MIPALPVSCKRPRNTNRRQGMSLVEVMVGTVLFTMLATGLTAAYVQNMRMAKAQSYRTQAINTALTMLEQLRANGYADLRTIYYEPTNPPAFVVKLVDPTQTTVEPKGYRDFSLPINVRDATELVPAWTQTALRMDTAPNAPTLPMRFWLALERDIATTGNVHAVFQLTLFYQWRTPGDTTGAWKTGNFRMAVPKLTVGIEDM